MKPLLRNHDQHLCAARAAAWQWWEEANQRAEAAWADYDAAFAQARCAEDAAVAARDAALELDSFFTLEAHRGCR